MQNAKDRVTRDTGFQSLIDLTIFSIKSLIAINGGAIIALLAFIGNILSKEIAYPLGISCALSWYCVGITSAILELMFAYFFQVFEIEGGAKFPCLWHNRECFRYLAIASAALSLASFIVGSIKTVNTFSNFTPTHSQKECCCR
ncbi:MAG: hypothetical protein K0R52_430 [Alphaproteobacteria bacterium]|jgi:hypothetical protein|nr:hypothetical protein [Alphaproteobacteria bacterium]